LGSKILQRHTGFAGRRRTRDQEIQVPTIRGRTGDLVACLLLGFARQLGSQLGAHLLEFIALPRLKDLENPAQSRGTQIVELILQALVVVAIILEHDGDLIGLFRGKIQLGPKVLKDSFPIGVSWWRRRCHPVEPVVQSIAHAQHPDSGAGQKYQ
jgi:hypothetical protein